MSIIIGLLWMLPTGCSGDNGPATESVTLYDIVCLRSQDKSGTTYTLTKPAGVSLITYTSRQLLDTTRVHVGDRCLLAYRMNDGKEPYTTGPIEARGYSPIYNETLHRAPLVEIVNNRGDGVYLMSLWQSEDFLNLRLRLPYTAGKRVLTIIVDESTLDKEYPDCYLVHDVEDGVNTFDREYYLSVDMGSLRKYPTCRGFNLILKNTNLDRDNYAFDFLTI